jgi:phosphatidylserine/phosphatidylglycerophosphate/cardiolipin synthase-like enzyme
MTWKTRILVCLTLLLVTFGGGAFTGYHYAKSHPVVRTVFTPYEDGIGNYLAELDKAHKDVYIAAYAFTDQRIADKLVWLAKERGVKIHVALDQSQSRGRSAPSERKIIEALRAVGAEVWIGTSEMKHEIMHNKFTVIDGHIVEDGSWNYTKAANFQGNVLNFVDDYDRAQKFIADWLRTVAFMKTQDQTLPVLNAGKDDDDDNGAGGAPTHRPRKR